MQHAPSGQRIEPSRLALPLKGRPVRIAFLAALLPILIIGAVFMAMLNAERTATLERMTERAASTAGTAIRQYVGEELGRLQGLAVSSAIDGRNWAAFHTEAQRLLQAHPHWINIILTDESRQVFNTRLFGQPLPPMRDPASARRAMEMARPVVGNVAQGETGIGTAFRVPVIRDGKPRYTLTAPARPALFSDALHAQNLPPGWRALVTDAHNTIVGDSGDSGAAVGTPLDPVFAAALTGALSRMITVRTGDGTDHHLAAAPAGQPGWHVLVLAPAGSAGGASRAIEYAIWAAIAAGAVLAVVLVAALLTATMSRRNVVSLARANARLRDSQQRQQLLAREIDHRAKNLLALVQTILRLTRAGTVSDYAHAAQGRIAALARAHTLLSQARWEGADLGGLVAEELAPLRGAGGSRVATHGPAVPLNAQAAQSMAMTLHELTTNAVKYGALSVPAGHVDVRWAWRGDALELAWEERGGPAVRRPEGSGVGMTVMDRCVAQQLQGTIRFDWHEAGLRCTMTVPRASLRRE